MADKTDFCPFDPFIKPSETSITSSMEDYLEMIYRLTAQKEFVRVGELAEKLNVRASSVSKMASNLKLSGHVAFEKYGYIRLTDKGHKTGRYLLYRHDVLCRFLKFINQTENETKQVEKIEHFLNEKTVRNIDKFLKNHGVF